MFAYGSFLRYSRPIFIMPTFVFDYIHFSHSAAAAFPRVRADPLSFAQSEERTRISQQQQQQQ